MCESTRVKVERDSSRFAEDATGQTPPQGAGRLPWSHLVLERPVGAHHFVEDVLGHVGVDRRQRVVQQVDVGFAVQSSGDAHPQIGRAHV